MASFLKTVPGRIHENKGTQRKKEKNWFVILWQKERVNFSIEISTGVTAVPVFSFCGCSTII